jgi:hypothetical protein
MHLCDKPRPGLLRVLAVMASMAAVMAPAGRALAQQPKPPPPAGAPPPVAPPTKGTDMELDPDATPPPPAPPPEKKPDELPPSDPNGWGQGGKDEEGKYAPGGEKKKTDVDEDTGPRDLGRPGDGFVDLVIGFGSMRDVTNDQNVTKLTVASFVFGARYRFGDSLSFGLRLPYSTGSIKGPLAGTTDDYNTFALGNLEASGRYSIELTKRLRLPIDLAFTFPLASGDLYSDPSDPGARAQALVNQAASYSRGFEEMPLFASKRLGLRIGAGITYDKNAIHVEAGTRLDVMGKVGGNSQFVTATGILDVTRTPNTNWLTGGSFFYDFLGGKLTPGLRAWLAVESLPVHGGTVDYSGPQFVLEPHVRGTFPLNASGSLAIRGGLGYILPIAGALGGGQKVGAQDSGSTGGLRIRADFLF